MKVDIIKNCIDRCGEGWWQSISERVCFSFYNKPKSIKDYYEFITEIGIGGLPMDDVYFSEEEEEHINYAIDQMIFAIKRLTKNSEYKLMFAFDEDIDKSLGLHFDFSHFFKWYTAKNLPYAYIPDPFGFTFEWVFVKDINEFELFLAFHSPDIDRHEHIFENSNWVIWDCLVDQIDFDVIESQIKTYQSQTHSAAVHHMINDFLKSHMLGKYRLLYKNDPHITPHVRFYFENECDFLATKLLITPEQCNG